MPKDQEKVPQTPMEEKAMLRSKNIRRYLRLYVIPIGAIFIFLGLMLALVIPKISLIFSSLDDVSKNNQTVADKVSQINDLKTLSGNSDSVYKQLNVINQTAPSGTTEVVKFRDKITALIQSFNLRVNSQKLSENDLAAQTQNDETNGTLTLQEVPFTFEVSGSYTDIVKFLEALSKIDDFIIVKEMELTAIVEGADTWSLKISMDKYQFSTLSKENSDKIYLNVPTTVKLSDIISKYIQTKLSSTSTNTTTNTNTNTNNTTTIPSTTTTGTPSQAPNIPK